MPADSCSICAHKMSNADACDAMTHSEAAYLTNDSAFSGRDARLTFRSIHARSVVALAAITIRSAHEIGRAPSCSLPLSIWLFTPSSFLTMSPRPLFSSRPASSLDSTTEPSMPPVLDA